MTAGVRFVGICWWLSGGLGIALKEGLACGIVLSLVHFSAAGATNEWTKPTSGYWEESYWSLGQMPGTNQELVAFRNPGWKALAIGANTTANYPTSLSLNNLLVEAPTDSFNQLLLNWAGFSVPLFVHSNLTIGTNGSLASHYSALRAANAYIDGSASFSDYSIEEFGQLWLRSGSTLNLTNGTMTCSNLTFYLGTFTQSGGTHVAQFITLPGLLSPFITPSGTYCLQGGTLTSGHLTLGYVLAPFYADGPGMFLQTGGVYTNFGMTLQGYYHPGAGTHAGQYRLEDGLLFSSYISNDGGSFVQNGGTNIVQDLNVRGGSYFILNGGELVTSNTPVAVDSYVDGWFEQSAGTHIVQGRLVIQATSLPSGGYRLEGGDLVTANMEVYGVLELSGTVSNTGILTLSRPISSDIFWRNIAVTAVTEQYLGQLQILSGGTVDMHILPTNATVLRFSDSHTLPWSGPLLIRHWGLNPGDHIYFGTNAQSLTAAQLAQVAFAMGNSNLQARLLGTGELVPAVPPPLLASRLSNALVLSWPGGYELVTATNFRGPYVAMPGALSPLTNRFTEPQRYFRLRLLGP